MVRRLYRRSSERQDTQRGQTPHRGRTSRVTHFDAIIIGTGQAGPSLAPSRADYALTPPETSAVSSYELSPLGVLGRARRRPKTASFTNPKIVRRFCATTFNQAIRPSIGK